MHRQEYPSKATKKTSGNKVTIRKIKGKAIDFNKNFKLYLVAYDSSGRKIGKSVRCHVAGKGQAKYTNPKSIKLETKKCIYC